MKEALEKFLPPVGGVTAVIVLFVVPEYLIFGFDEQARRDWVRMLPAAIMSPFIWAMAITWAWGSIAFWFMCLKDGSPHVVFFGTLISFALFLPGVRIPRYWIQRIVYDNVPAFGSNPNNIYAVTGLNSIGLGLQWAFQGAVAGLAVGAVLTVAFLIVRGLRRLV